MEQVAQAPTLNTESSRLIHEDTERGIKFMQGTAVRKHITDISRVRELMLNPLSVEYQPPQNT